jgi:potassium efflux system protein
MALAAFTALSTSPAWAQAATPTTSTPTPAAAAAPAPKPATVAPTAPAPVVDPVAAASTSLDLAQQRLVQLQNQTAATSNDARLATMGGQAATIQASADAVAKARAGDLAAIAQSLKRYAPRGRRPQTAAQREASAPLLARQKVLQTQLREAQLTASSASYTFSLIAERRREGFSARVLERSASPLSPDFWTSLADEADADVTRVMALAQQAIGFAFDAEEPRGVLSLGFGLVVALILFWPARRFLEKLGRRTIDSQNPPQGFALSAPALWIALVDTGAPALGAAILHLSAQWGGLLSPKANALAGAAVVAVAWGAAILALGRAIATDANGERRLLNLPDEAADRVRFSLWAVAIITAAGFLLTRLNYVVGASVAATIAANCLLSLAYSAAAGLILFSLGGDRAPSAPGAELPAEGPRSPAWTLLSLTLTTAIIVTLGGVFAGYTTLASLISSQIFWLSILAAVTYLLLRFIDDVVAMLFRDRGWAAQTLLALFRLRRTTIRQMGVLISAGLQLLVLIGAVSLALTPFGQSGDLLLAHFSQFGKPIHVGSATVEPGAIAVGLVTLFVGIGIVRLFRGWVVKRYLPVTGWDAGVRNSVSTGVGYLGVGITLLCALSAMGLGFKQIALIASALSVGIGFGLQQVVQNFVSGLILLVERPVKVGDWIKVDGAEGDVRRIRVRATEIQAFDRSIVIVPNSDLITKQVQNKTLGEQRARILLQLGIGNPNDAIRARALILDLAKAKSEVLTDPPPAVYIDSLESGGAVKFNCYLFVKSPRDVTRVRSEVYFDIIAAFHENHIDFLGAAGPANIVVEPGPTMQTLLEAAPRPKMAEPGTAEPKPEPKTMEGS